jgi:hypothetical protein
VETGKGKSLLRIRHLPCFDGAYSGYNAGTTEVSWRCVMPNPRRAIMSSLKLWKGAAIAASLVGGGLSLVGVAASPATSKSGYELSHPVPFEVGATRLRDGDSITVEEVTGTSEKMSAGNTYVIKGSFKLASQKRATLLASVTANRPKQGPGVPTQRTQSVLVDQGDGHFSLILYMAYDGNPHVGFYPADGESFANLYFGTGDSVLKRGWWEKAE